MLNTKYDAKKEKILSTISIILGLISIVLVIVFIVLPFTSDINQFRESYFEGYILTNHVLGSTSWRNYAIAAVVAIVGYVCAAQARKFYDDTDPWGVRFMGKKMTRAARWGRACNFVAMIITFALIGLIFIAWDLPLLWFL